MMSTWLSTHGVGAIRAQDTTAFVLYTNERGSILKPTNANELKATVYFTLPSPPSRTTEMTSVAIDFSSQTARVDALRILSGIEELWEKKLLGKTDEFRLPIPNKDRANISSTVAEGKGLALAVTVDFESVHGEIEFRSVGLQVSVPSPAVQAPPPPPPTQTIKLDCGVWNTTDVRRWDEPTKQTETRIAFNTVFSAPPMVSVSLNSADVGTGEEGVFRAKVYATKVDVKGFTVHADTWSSTAMYSAGVSWVAIGF
ncbi:hypothetical protein QBC35DRAFT_507321 [Podospora australis]|uniref:H-type lectin domain-containing protein n=1 Tax=Podospora australis TaxID=1536484 RepID=A0AAN6WKZ8_9PEZI|nr:hypothetical protein QBC35DRAFT_507321 [Podospora australis]